MEKMSKEGFTLAEVLVTLAIIGVVAALTIPSVIKKYQEIATVSAFKKNYRNLAAAVQEWQIEEGCSDDVRNCGSLKNGTDLAFYGIEKKLKMLKKHCGSNEIENIDWLPEVTVHLNGTKQTKGWSGVSKSFGGYLSTCCYLLADGTTMSVTKENSQGQLFGYIDVNGAKPPNRIGKDTFPFGIGAFGGLRYTALHPNIPDDDTHYGTCRIQSNDGYCDPDFCTKDLCSPSAYILKHGKLPPIKW